MTAAGREQFAPKKTWSAWLIAEAMEPLTTSCGNVCVTQAGEELIVAQVSFKKRLK